jgi:hypothetical protein
MSSNTESQDKMKPPLTRHGTIIIPELQVYNRDHHLKPRGVLTLMNWYFFRGEFDVEPVPAQKRSPTPLSASFLIRSTIP